MTAEPAPQKARLSIPARNKRIRQMYEHEGASLAQLSREFGISKQHVGRVLQVHGIKRRPRGRPSARK